MSATTRKGVVMNALYVKRFIRLLRLWQENHDTWSEAKIAQWERLFNAVRERCYEDDEWGTELIRVAEIVRLRYEK